MLKFPSIEQYRNVIRHVKTHAQYAGRDENGDAIIDHSKPIPTLSFRGTVKLHGTNAGIVYDTADDSFAYQSRERVLSLTSDNAGFMLAMMKDEHRMRSVMRDIAGRYISDVDGSHGITKVAVFGEWCGAGIQKGVAISQIPKTFIIFAVKLVMEDESTVWLDISDEKFQVGHEYFYNIHNFDTYEIDIDFTYPEIAQEKMIRITEEVENECPVGKAFGVSGIGEGVVWTCVSPGWDDSGTWFKVKGEKHSVSKVKTLAAVDVEAVANLKSFVDSTVTEARLEQGLWNLVNEQLKPVEMASMGDFIRWVFNDIIKEETDTVVASGFDPKKLAGPVANVARPWFVKKINAGG